MSRSLNCFSDIEGDFPLHNAVIAAMPIGTKVLSACSYGVSAWTKTAKISVLLQDGSPKDYFLKCATGHGALQLASGEYRSALAINTIVPSFSPQPIAWGSYHSQDQTHTQTHFYLSTHHTMDLLTPPNPQTLMTHLAKLHTHSTSPTNKFGFPVPTVLGIFPRTVQWESSWAKCFANQLNDVLRYDFATNGPWPALDTVSRHLITHVVSRLLDVLQSEGRSIKPSLIHGDLWEQNIGIDIETGEPVVFDPGCTYAHNEMEFGTWRCSWATYFRREEYLECYWEKVGKSEPVGEWGDRNRLYGLHAYLNDSAGHRGSVSRALAYNDMLFLCEKYAPCNDFERYDEEKDISVTRRYLQHETHSMKEMYLKSQLIEV